MPFAGASLRLAHVVRLVGRSNPFHPPPIDNATHQVGQRRRSLGPEPSATLARRLRRSWCDLSGIVIGSDVAAAPGQTSQGDERRGFVVTVKNV